MSPGPASPSKRRDQERAAIIHGTCRSRMPPTVPACSLLCGGADVLACIIRSDPKTRQIGAWKTARPGAPRWPCSPMRFECKGAGSCAWGVMPSPLHAVRMKRCGHLVPFRTKSRPRPRCGSLVPDMSRNKRGYLQGSPTTATAAFKDAAYYGGLCCVRACVCAACMLVSVQALAARPT